MTTNPSTPESRAPAVKVLNGVQELFREWSDLQGSLTQATLMTGGEASQAMLKEKCEEVNQLFNNFVGKMRAMASNYGETRTIRTTTRQHSKALIPPTGGPVIPPPLVTFSSPLSQPQPRPPQSRVQEFTL